MQIFEQGSVVRVPFPYTDRPVRQHRPALVVSAVATGPLRDLLWVVMITSSENRRWPGDVELGSAYREVGLPAPSIIRTAKIATCETKQVDGIGRISSVTLEEVMALINATLGS